MKKTILAVEDNTTHADLLIAVLEAKGYDVVWAQSGQAALNSVAAQSPDLILMDIQLPDISGIEVTKSLKQNDATKDIPILALTAFAFPEDERAMREAGCIEYFTKPYTFEVLLKALQRYLGPSLALSEAS